MQNLRHLARIPTGLSYLLRRPRAWGQPIFFTIETINSCNFRCSYCPQSDPQHHFVNGRGSMAMGDFVRIIANLRSAFDMRIVSLHRDGEPLLNMRLEEYIEHLASLKICVTISSNCSLLPRERARSLVASGLEMIGTDFCSDAELYERLRVRGKWETTLAGIRNMLEAAEDAGSRLRVVIKDIGTYGRPQSEIGPVMDRTRKLFTQWSDRVTVLPVYFHNSLGESLLSLSAAPTADERQSYTLCHQPWTNLTIDFAGRVVACCRDLRSEYVVGNLLEQPAAEIWNGAPMIRLRQALAAEQPGDIKICGSCDVPWHGSYSGRTPYQKIRNFFMAKAWMR